MKSSSYTTHLVFSSINSEQDIYQLVALSAIFQLAFFSFFTLFSRFFLAFFSLDFFVFLFIYFYLFYLFLFIYFSFSG